MVFTTGSRIRASELNRLGALVGRNQRTTNSAAFTTIVRILSTRGAVKSGRTYRVRSQCEVFPTGGTGISQMELRYTTNDTEPTTGSTVLGRALTGHDTAGVPDTVTIETYHYASADGFLRVALCGTKVGGTGTGCAVSADATFPCFITIEDTSDTVATSGIVY